MKDQSTKGNYVIIAAIITTLGVIIAAFFQQDLFAQEIIHVFEFKDRDITIWASPFESGASVYYAGDGLLKFTDIIGDISISGVGDTYQDQTTRTFLTFYLDELPQDAEITDFVLTIPCAVSGSPQALGNLNLAVIDFGTYDQSDFYLSNNSEINLTFFESENLIDSCKQTNQLSFTHLKLNKVLQSHIEKGLPIQFTIYFLGSDNNEYVIPNHITDAISITGIPSLYINYRSKE